MWLAVSREGTKVVVKLPTVLGYHYAFSIEAGSEVSAQLLVADMDKRIDDAVQEARRSSYDAGWADAKGKKKPKRAWHHRALDVQ